MDADERANLLTTKDVAERLGVRVSTVYDYVHRGEIAYRRIGSKSIRFTEGDLAEFIGGPRRESHP